MDKNELTQNHNEIRESKEDEKLQDFVYSNDRVLRITRENSNYQKWIEKTISIAKVAADTVGLTKETTFIAQIPVDVLADYKKGINTIMKNPDTGKLKPIIVGPKDGKKRTVLKQMDLIEKQGFSAESLNNLSASINDLIHQQQMARLEDKLKSVEEGIKRIEMAQEAQMEGKIQAGVEQIRRALQTTDPIEKQRLLNDGRNNLETATGQIGSLLEKRCESFIPISENSFKRWLDSLGSGKAYHEARIKDYNAIYDLNDQYMSGRGLLAASYAYEGNEEQVLLVLNSTNEFLDKINTDKISSITNLPKLKDKRLFLDSWEERIKDQVEESKLMISGYEAVEIEYDMKDLVKEIEND